VIGKARSFLLLSVSSVLLCAGTWSAVAQNTSDLCAAYVNGDERLRAEIVSNLVSMGDGGLPVLTNILATASLWQSHSEPDDVKRLDARVRVIDAIARIGTVKALDDLHTRADGSEVRGQSGCDFDAMRALAHMGSNGLQRLLRISQQTRSYRPHRLDLHRERSFIPFPEEQQLPTTAANMAPLAIALVSDPAASPVLGKLIDQPRMRQAAFLALANIKSPGYEEDALRLWQQESLPAALKYLLAISREKYLPLLQQRLKPLDDEISRLLRDAADLKARGARDFISDDRVVQVIFEMGGCPDANATLSRYVESRLWVTHDEHMAVRGVMALGKSGSADARQTLVRLLTDASPVEYFKYSNESLYWFGYSFSRYHLDGSGSAGIRIPMFILAAAALQELGDPSVIPKLEEAATVHDQRFKPFFERVVTVLRGRSR